MFNTMLLRSHSGQQLHESVWCQILFLGVRSPGREQVWKYAMVRHGCLMARLLALAPRSQNACSAWFKNAVSRLNRLSQALPPFQLT